MSDKKQTAVQWLFKHARLDMSIYDWLLCIEHAEKMEKEQIEKAWHDGDAYQYSTSQTGEQYYNKNYGK
jgi:hypothetical protein